MKVVGRVVLLFLVVVVGTLMTASQATAAASCHTINAKGAGQDLGGGVTEADIRRRDGGVQCLCMVTGATGKLAGATGTLLLDGMPG